MQVQKQRGGKRIKRELGFVHVILLVLFLLGATTFGVVATQAELLARSSKTDLKTAHVLTQAKLGLLDFALGDGINILQAEYGRTPKVDAFLVNNPADRQDNTYVFARPGQLPCPDNTGNRSPSNRLEPIGVASENDGNLDGISDYPLNNCTAIKLSSPVLEALTNNSHLGRLPWREFYDNIRAIRAVFAGEGDGLDGNNDRLWYGVSPNLTEQKTPLNRNRLQRLQDNWLSVRVVPIPFASQTSPQLNVPFNLLTINDVAAVIMSPGVAGTIGSRVQTRTRELSIFSQLTVNNLINANIAPNYLDGGTSGANFKVTLNNHTITLATNYDLDLEFDKAVGDVPDYIDKLEYVHRDEILRVMADSERRNVDRRLDGIADALASYYQRNRHLPEPASFDSSNSSYINRRYAASHQLNPILINSNRAAASPLPYASIEATLALLQGAAVKNSNINAYWMNATSVSILTDRSRGLRGDLQGDVPLIYPSQLPLIITAALSDSSSFMPPFGENTHVNGTLAIAEVHSELAAVIPPGTPFRTVRPFMMPAYGSLNLCPRAQASTPACMTSDSRNIPLTDPAGFMSQRSTPSYSGRGAFSISLAASVVNDIQAGNNLLHLYPLTPANQYNVVQANYQPDVLFNLFRYGHSAIIPEGTWLVANTTVTLVGNGVHHSNVGDRLVGPFNYAYQAYFDPTTRFSYGSSFNLTDTIANTNFPRPVREIYIPENTPVIANSQGLLPAHLMPSQLRGSDATLAHRDEGISLFTPHYIKEAGLTLKGSALVMHPDGAFGYFPAEVTMHPLQDLRIEITTVAQENATRAVSISIATEFDFTSAYVQPMPIAGVTSAVVPGRLHVAGFISIPAGSRFYYPVGTRIPLGQNSFTHAHNNYVFDQFYGVYPLTRSASNITVYAKAYLAPGAVIANSRFISNTPAARILPSGVQALQRNVELVTLVNGGILSYERLLHYTDGDLTLLPKTAAQRAFRIEGEGLKLIDNLSTNNTLITIHPLSLAQLTIAGHDLVDGATFINYRNSGVYLYPYFAAYEERGVRLRPNFFPTVVSVTVTDTPIGGTPVVTTSTIVNFEFDSAVQDTSLEEYRSFIDVPISRSDFWYYNTGVLADKAITLTQHNTTYSRNRSANAFNLIDGRGVGLESAGDVSESASTYPLLPLSVTLLITLDMERGIHLQANPSRLMFNYNDTNNSSVTVLRAALAMAQFGNSADTSPLVLPQLPDALMSPLATFEFERTISNLGVISTLTATLDARAAQAGINLPGAGLITVNDFTEFGITTPSEIVELGDNFASAAHAIIKLDSDALFASYNLVSGVPSALVPDLSDRIPKGSHLEVGWLENYHYSSSTNTTLRFFTPGMRVANGIGYYPAPLAGKLRMRRDTSSFVGPSSITIYTSYDFTITSAATPPVKTTTTVATTITLADPQMLLPAGKLIDRFEMVASGVCSSRPTTPPPPPSPPSCLGLDKDVLLFNDTTVFSSSNFDMVYILASSTLDFRSLRFDFAANGDGGIVTTIGIDEVEVDQFHDGQLFRMRIAEHLPVGAPMGSSVTMSVSIGTTQSITTFFTVRTPQSNVIPWIDMSWSGSEQHFGYGDMAHEDLLFSQNNPMFYAVSEQCRRDLLGNADDCSFNSETGLNVTVPPGEFVRLPEETPSPGGLIIHAFQPYIGNVASSNANLRIVYQVGGSNTTISARGARIAHNGRVEVMGSSGNNILTLSAALGAALGTTVSIVPGNNGVLFQHNTSSNASAVSVHTPSSDTGAGYLDILEIIEGGFTHGSPALAAYRVAVPANSLMTMGIATTIEFKDTGTRTQIFLGEGSSASNVDMSGWHLLASSNQLLSIVSTLSHSAMQYTKGGELPQLLASGITITIDTNEFRSSIARSNKLSLAAGEQVVVPSTGRVMQALIKGTHVTLLGSAENRAESNWFYSRSLPIRNSSLTLSTPLGIANDRALRYSGIDSYFSQNLFSMVVVTLATLANPALTTVELSTLRDVGSATDLDGCWMCRVRNFSIDIRTHATATNALVLANGTTISTYSYNDLATVIVSLTGQQEVLLATTSGANLELHDFLGETDFSLTIPLKSGTTEHNEPFIEIDVLSLANTTPLSDNYIVPVSITTSSHLVNAYYDVPAIAFIFQRPGTKITIFTPNLEAYTGDIFFGNVSTPVTVLDPNMREETVLALDQLGIGGEDFTITMQANPASRFTLDTGLEFALFGRNDTTQSPIFNSIPDTVAVDLDSPAAIPLLNRFDLNGLSSVQKVEVAKFSQLYFDGGDDWTVYFDGIEELGFQLPTESFISGGRTLPAGSMVYPLSKLVLQAKKFNATQPFTITLNAAGASGNLVGGGGAGSAYAYRRNALLTTAGALGMLTNMSINLGIRQVAANAVVTASQNTIANISLNSNIAYHSFPGITVDDIDARPHGGVLKRNVTVGGATYTNVDRSPGLVDSNLMTQPEYEFLSAHHRITFPANAVLEIRPPDTDPDSFGDYVLPVATEVNYVLPVPDTNTAALVTTTPITATATRTTNIGGYRIPPVILPPNYFSFDNGTTAQLGRMSTSFAKTIARALAAPRVEDQSNISSPLRQNLWIRTLGTLTIVEPDTNTTLVLPPNSVINPLQGTYLAAESNLSTPDYEEIELTGPTEILSGVSMVFAPAALLLPAGVTINSGSDSLIFEDVKAIIAYSPAPLVPDPSSATTVSSNLVQCGQTAFGSYYPEEINQLIEGVDVATQILPDSSYHLSISIKFTVTTSGTPSETTFSETTSFPAANLNYAHPCLQLDIFENIDADREFIYTSGMLEYPRRSVSSNFIAPRLQRVNDRMRMIGGSLK